MSRIAIIIGFICIVAYSNSLLNSFVWDDKVYIEGNQEIKSFFPISKFFGKSLIPQRPILLVSFTLEYFLWELNPSGWHLTSLVIHIICSIFVFLLTDLFLKNRIVSILSGILFSLHPVHSETVNYMIGRSELLAVAFGLWFVLFYLMSLDKKSIFFYFSSLILFALSLFSKESGIVFFGILILVIFYKRVISFKNILKIIPFFLLAVFYFIFWFYSVKGGSLFAIAQKGWWGGSPYNTFLMMMTVITEYARLLFFPYELSPWYVTEQVTSFFHIKVLFGFFLLICILGLTIWKVQQKSFSGFALSWILLGILPVSNIFPIPGSMMAERWLYLSSVGFCMMVGIWIEGIWKRIEYAKNILAKRILFILCSLLFIILGIRTFTANAFWRNDETLFKRIVEKFPNSFKGHANLGKTYLDSGRLEEAKKELQIAVKLKEDHPLPHVWLGEIFFRNRDFSNALNEYQKALEIKQDIPNVHFKMSQIYFQMKEYNTAISEMRKEIALQDSSSELHLVLSEILRVSGDEKEAEKERDIAKKLLKKNEKSK